MKKNIVEIYLPNKAGLAEIYTTVMENAFRLARDNGQHRDITVLFYPFELSEMIWQLIHVKHHPEGEWMGDPLGDVWAVRAKKLAISYIFTTLEWDDQRYANQTCSYWPDGSWANYDYLQKTPPDSLITTGCLDKGCKRLHILGTKYRGLLRKSWMPDVDYR